MLNRIIRIAASVLGATLLFAGCTKVLDSASAEGNIPISFDAESPLLRDDVTKASAPLAAGTTFGVFAFLQPGTVESPGTWNSSRTPDFMFNQDVYYNGSTYAYSPTRFWPTAGNTISFWAYCPYSSNSSVFKTSNGSDYTRTSTGWPDLYFSVTDGKTDLLSSNKLTNRSRPANNTVSINFYHQLSKISINICKQDPTSRYTVRLKSIRFDGIYQTAVFRPTDWRNWSNRSSFIVYTDNPADNTDDIELSTSNYAFDAVMLIPQDLNYENAKVHVEYSISYTGILHERTNAGEKLLSEIFTTDDSKWVKNKQYTLNITVVPNDPIEFTVSWSDWGDVYNYHITS